MNPTIIFLFLFSAVPVLVVVVMPRIRMERRARDLLAQHPDAERTSVYLEFGWRSPVGKRREMDAKIAEMAAEGWTFLRATEAGLARTSRSWGGGITLQFIRIPSESPSCRRGDGRSSRVTDN